MTDSESAFIRCFLLALFLAEISTSDLRQELHLRRTCHARIDRRLRKYSSEDIEREVRRRQLLADVRHAR